MNISVLDKELTVRLQNCFDLTVRFVDKFFNSAVICFLFFFLRLGEYCYTFMFLCNHLHVYDVTSPRWLEKRRIVRMRNEERLTSEINSSHSQVDTIRMR